LVGLLLLVLVDLLGGEMVDFVVDVGGNMEGILACSQSILTGETLLLACVELYVLAVDALISVDWIPKRIGSLAALPLLTLLQPN
jgi:hypothetical protein